MCILACLVIALASGSGASADETVTTEATTTTETPTTTTDVPTTTTDGPVTIAEDPTTTTEAPTTTTTELVAPTRYQQSDYRLTYVGPWYTTSTGSASGGTFYYTAVGGSAVLVEFNGTAIELLATTGVSYGKALVSLDGGPEEYIDFYSSSTLYKQSVYRKTELAPGPHTLSVRCAGDKNGSSTGYAVSLDALDVTGSLTQAQTSNAAVGNQIAGLPNAEWLGLRLAQWSRGPAVAWLEQRLTDLSYRPGPIDGYFDARTRMAVIAFQKWHWLTRDGVVTGSVWGKLVSAKRPVPKFSYTGKWIEVNKQKQVLLYCVSGNVERTLAVSTGSARVGIVTPTGPVSHHEKEHVRTGALQTPLPDPAVACHTRVSVGAYLSRQPRVRPHDVGRHERAQPLDTRGDHRARLLVCRL